jgi:drug/metabolite transporter (DMT)-like permease
MHDLAGILLGLTAALVWGTTDVVATLASRRVGSLVATAGTQIVSLATIALLVLVTGTRIPDDPSVIAMALASGVISATAYLAFFTALRHGPITIVSPVVSMYGGLTVVLSVLLLGEALAPLQAVGVVVATSGVVLAAVAFDGGIRRARLVGPGVAYAMVALVAFAAVTILLSGPIRSAGWLPIMLLARIANAGTVWVIYGVARVARRPGASTSTGRSLDRRAVGLLVAAGLLDTAGFVAFAAGLQVSETWLIGITSSFGPVVAVAVGVLLFGERPRPIQWLGLGFVAASVFFIALG